MPQVFQVLCCYNCEMFQVHFVKKSTKWQCKLCNEKQSLKKAFMIGPAPECRSLVQELNMQKGLQEMNKNAKKWEKTENAASDERYILDPSQIGDEEHSDEVTFNEDEYETWAKDDNVDYRDNRHLSENGHEFYNETSTSEKNFFAEDVKLPQTFETKSEMSNRMYETEKQHDPLIDKNIRNCLEQKKRLFVTSADISSQLAIQPPFKKNRGFQLIKNAASKLS